MLRRNHAAEEWAIFQPGGALPYESPRHRLVLEALREMGGEASVRHIAVALYGEPPSPSEIKTVRGALRHLYRYGLISHEWRASAAPEPELAALPA